MGFEGWQAQSFEPAGAVRLARLPVKSPVQGTCTPPRPPGRASSATTASSPPSPVHPGSYVLRSYLCVRSPLSPRRAPALALDSRGGASSRAGARGPLARLRRLRRGGCAGLLEPLGSRSSASSRFRAWLRASCATAVTRAPKRARRRRFWSSVSAADSSIRRPPRSARRSRSRAGRPARTTGTPGSRTSASGIIGCSTHAHVLRFASRRAGPALRPSSGNGPTCTAPRPGRRCRRPARR